MGGQRGTDIVDGKRSTETEKRKSLYRLIFGSSRVAGQRHWFTRCMGNKVVGASLGA